MNIGGSDHPIKWELTQRITGAKSPEEIVEAVMRTLHDMQFVTYRGADVIPILAPAGRVLADLGVHRDSSLRELSQRLGTTESSVTKQMTHLVEAGLIERTRVGKRNRYKLNLNNVLQHPDIAALIEAIINGDHGDE